MKYYYQNETLNELKREFDLYKKQKHIEMNKLKDKILWYTANQDMINANDKLVSTYTYTNLL